jgi:nucleoside phosphorylase
MISTPVSISSQKATTSKIPPREFRAKDYNVAWICALPDVELLAARLMLDEYQAPPSYDSNFDDNTYIFGRIHGHRIVLASLQNGQTGNINAARLTGSLFKTFPNIKIALLVGIGGGVPRPISRQDPLEDIHLGDVVIGWPGDGEPAVICWDSGRSKAHGVFERLGTIDSPDSRLTQGLAVLASNHDVNQTNFQQHLARLRKDPNFARPGLDHDRLFESTYHHVGEYNNNCALCDPTQLVKRNARVEEDEKKFIFHRGRIATGSSVVQDAELRDRISKDSNGVLCIEMEAAGVDVNAKCLVIRGISDYADSHKNDSWKFYAAGNAAAFAREFLCTLNPTVIEILKREA